MITVPGIESSLKQTFVKESPAKVPSDYVALSVKGPARSFAVAHTDPPPQEKFTGLSPRYPSTGATMPGRFEYTQFDEVSRRQQKHMKESFERLTHDFETLFLVGRARSLVLTKLEEAYMWVGKAIRDDQADRESKSPGSTKTGGQV